MTAAHWLYLFPVCLATLLGTKYVFLIRQINRAERAYYSRMNVVDYVGSTFDTSRAALAAQPGEQP